MAEVWESLGRVAARAEIKEAVGQGQLSTCLLRQLSFIMVRLSVVGSCYCSATDLILNTGGGKLPGTLSCVFVSVKVNYHR